MTNQMMSCRTVLLSLQRKLSHAVTRCGQATTGNRLSVATSPPCYISPALGQHAQQLSWAEGQIGCSPANDPQAPHPSTASMLEIATD